MSQPKFWGKRSHQQGQMSVKTGFRASKVAFKVALPGVQAAVLTYEQACDLADTLVDALDAHDEDPLV